MKKSICDRCGMPTGETYYIIDIYANSERPGKTMEECAHNMSQNFRNILRGHKQYCKECKDKIEKYIEKEPCKTI